MCNSEAVHKEPDVIVAMSNAGMVDKSVTGAWMDFEPAAPVQMQRATALFSE